MTLKSRLLIRSWPVLFSVTAVLNRILDRLASRAPYCRFARPPPPPPLPAEAPVGAAAELSLSVGFAIKQWTKDQVVCEEDACEPYDRREAESNSAGGR